MRHAALNDAATSKKVPSKVPVGREGGVGETAGRCPADTFNIIRGAVLSG